MTAPRFICRNTKKALAERGPSIHDVEIATQHIIVMPREGGAPSMPQLIGSSIRDARGEGDVPVEATSSPAKRPPNTPKRTFIHIPVTRRAEFIFSCLPNRFSSGVVELLCEPFRLRLTGMESTDVDEVNVVRGGLSRAQRDERHGRTRFRGVPLLRSGDIAAGLRRSYELCGALRTRAVRRDTSLSYMKNSTRAKTRRCVMRAAVAEEVVVVAVAADN